jgi:hypothetical protein
MHVVQLYDSVTSIVRLDEEAIRFSRDAAAVAEDGPKKAH